MAQHEFSSRVELLHVLAHGWKVKPNPSAPSSPRYLHSSFNQGCPNAASFKVFLDAHHREVSIATTHVRQRDPTSSNDPSWCRLAICQRHDKAMFPILELVAHCSFGIQFALEKMSFGSLHKLSPISRWRERWRKMFESRTIIAVFANSVRTGAKTSGPPESRTTRVSTLNVAMCTTLLCTSSCSALIFVPGGQLHWHFLSSIA